MRHEVSQIISEAEKVIIGKRDVMEKIIMAVLVNGHVLLDDVPGVGKTSIAITLGRTLGLRYSRIQFTPDVLASDVVGFSIYNKETGDFDYKPGVVANTNILLGDEINRTSSKTQSALLEAMEERQVTVDGKVYLLNNPFIVIATQNQVGTAGTQLLPHAQLDRFLLRLKVGYPDFDSEMEILRGRQKLDPMSAVEQVSSRESVLEMQEVVQNVVIKDEILSYITRLAAATREHSLIELGLSPRGTLAISRVARASAYVNDRDYVIPEDVREILMDVCAHRIIPNQRARGERLTAEEILRDILNKVKVPHSLKQG